MFKIIKNSKNYRLLVGLFFGFLVSSSMVVYAWNNDHSDEVSYDSSHNWLHSTTVQGALDELVKHRNCPLGYSCYQKKTTFDVGDYIIYTPSKTSYATDTTKTGYTSTQTINPSELNLWRVLSINQDGTVDIISEYVSSIDVAFVGKEGYKNYVGYLNLLASQYETTGITVGSRYFGYSNQTEYITSDTYFVNPAPWICSTSGTCSPNPRDFEVYGGGDTGYLSDYDLVNTVLGTRVANKVGTSTASDYWMASRYYLYSSATDYFWAVRFSDDGNYGNRKMYYYNSGSFSTYGYGYPIRPIVRLKSGLSYSGVGNKDFPFEIQGMATATIYYNSNANSGSTTIASETVSCLLSSGSCTVNIPSEVTSSVGTWNNAYAGLSSSTGNMTVAVSSSATSITLTGNATYYSLYRSSLTNYYYNYGYKNRKLYRNQWFTSSSEMASTVLSTSTTGTSNYGTAVGPGSSSWVGLSTGKDTTAEYGNVAAAASSAADSLYTVYQFSASFLKGSNVSSIGASSGSCRVTTSSTVCNVTLPSITPNSNFTSAGWSTTSGAITGTSAGSDYTIRSNGIVLYANANAVQPQANSFSFSVTQTSAGMCKLNSGAANYSSTVLACLVYHTTAATCPTNVTYLTGTKYQTSCRIGADYQSQTFDCSERICFKVTTNDYGPSTYSYYASEPLSSYAS